MAVRPDAAERVAPHTAGWYAEGLGPAPAASPIVIAERADRALRALTS